MDALFHTIFRIEKCCWGARFWAKSDLPPGSAELSVTVGSANPVYWTEIASGTKWPAAHFALSSEWRQFDFDLRELGFDADHLAPEVGNQFGGLHFAMPPNRPYDLWLDDVALITLYPQ
jgi:hypothetical protein